MITRITHAFSIKEQSPSIAVGERIPAIDENGELSLLEEVKSIELEEISINTEEEKKYTALAYVVRGGKEERILETYPFGSVIVQYSK